VGNSQLMHRKLSTTYLTDAYLLVKKLKEGTLKPEDLTKWDHYAILQGADSSSKLTIFGKSPTKKYLSELMGISTTRINTLLQDLRASYGHTYPLSPREFIVLDDTLGVIKSVYEKVMLEAADKGDYASQWKFTKEVVELGQSLGFINKATQKVEVSGTGLIGILMDKSKREDLEKLADKIVDDTDYDKAWGPNSNNPPSNPTYDVDSFVKPIRNAPGLPESDSFDKSDE
jgi:hypothetical protein